MTEEFDRVAPILQPAVDRAVGYELEDVREAIEGGQMILWPGQESAMVTQILTYPRAKVLYFFLAAGNMEEIQRLYDIIIDWGRHVGCTHASFCGRRGWERTFLTKEEGWEHKLAVFEKEL